MLLGNILTPDDPGYYVVYSQHQLGFLVSFWCWAYVCWIGCTRRALAYGHDASCVALHDLVNCKWLSILMDSFNCSAMVAWKCLYLWRLSCRVICVRFLHSCTQECCCELCMSGHALFDRRNMVCGCCVMEKDYVSSFLLDFVGLSSFLCWMGALLQAWQILSVHVLRCFGDHVVCVVLCLVLYMVNVYDTAWFWTVNCHA